MPRRKKDNISENNSAIINNSNNYDDIIKGQPVINIGLVGHVDHGKTTLTERLSGKWTDTHSEELKRGITIKLGYADTVFYKIPGKEGIDAYTVKPINPETKEKNIPVRKVSFVDAPGHEALMATMLTGATIMDGALLLIAANEPCPRPQTREHLTALQIAGIKHVIIVQNKIDLVTEERALRNYNQIKEFLKETPYKDAPIIPISAQRGVNINALIYAIEKYIPTPKRDETLNPIMFIARSFDINKPGTSIDDLKGGVVGGSIVQGKLKVGDRIELRPGLIYEEANKIKAKPLFAKIISAKTGNQPLNVIKPGGSVALMTSLDPAVVKSDQLIGNVISKPGENYPIWYSLKISINLLDRVVGSEEEKKVNPLVLNEMLMLNVNSSATVGIVRELKKNYAILELKKPVAAKLGDKVSISRMIGTRFRLIGYGLIEDHNDKFV